MNFAQRLQQLNGFKIVYIFDDSGSMNATLMDSPLNKEDTLMRVTRWDELKYFAKISMEISTLFDPDGCSIYFLNKQPSPVHNVKDELLLESLFNFTPRGYTPLPLVLSQVLSNHMADLNERKLLIIICTDGEPSDNRGQPAINKFKQVLQSRSPRVFTTIVACTDDDDSIEYLNEWDRQLSNLDVVDDYRSEKKEVKRAQGAQFSFSFGDYVVKSLIGSIDPEIDDLDEIKKKKMKCLIL